MFKIENDRLEAIISPLGAELQGLRDKNTGLQYMWEADPAYWPKYSPVLFPIVGSLKNNTYWYEGLPYTLSRHGFAREMAFSLNRQTPDEITLVLQDTSDTLVKYPFPFELYISYTLKDATLSVSYRVVNTGKAPMYFSIGGHPAFKVPLYDGESYEDYALEFEQKETAGRWLLEGGLLKAATEPLLQNDDRLVLKKDLFLTDAIVLKGLKSQQVSLVSRKSGKVFRFDFPGFPYLGIWAAPGADFVCIEPWCGIADAADSSQQLQEKEGIHNLQAGETFERAWRFSVIS